MKINVVFEAPDKPDKMFEAEYEIAMPGVGHINRMVKQVQQNPLGAQKSLILSCIEDADRDRFLDDSERYPGITVTVAGKLLEYAGFNAEATAKN